MKTLILVTCLVLSSASAFASEITLKNGESIELGGAKVSCETQTQVTSRCDLVETEGTGSTAGTHAVYLDGKKIARFQQTSNSNGEWEHRHNQALAYCHQLETRRHCICNL